MTVNPDITPNAPGPKGLPEDIRRSVRAASRGTGVDFSYLVAQAAAESGFDSKARAVTSSAAGLYQFLEGTWLDMVRERGHDYGLGSYATAIENGTLTPEQREQVLAYRDDPRLSAAMAGEYARANRERLEASVGRSVGPTELYLAHFLGPGGAERFLAALESDGGQRADTLLPAAANANQSVFHANGRPRSVREVYNHFAAKFEAPAAAPHDAAPKLSVDAPVRREDPVAPDRSRDPSGGGDGATVAGNWHRPPAYTHTRLSEASLLYLASIDLDRARSVL